MATTKKALQLANELADELRKRCADYGEIIEGFDANGFPYIRLSDGAPATHDDTVLIRVRPREWALATDIIGNAQTVYALSKIEIIVEADTGNAVMAPWVSIPHIMDILSAATLRGCLVEYRETAEATVPAIAASTTLVHSFEDLYWNMQSSQ
jgi:hypothetical protein